MTDTKWTPGPWSVERHTGTDQYITSHDDWSINDDNGGSICFEGRANDRAAANADLIAAAPDLYEALQEAADLCSGTFAHNGSPRKRMLAALAKARGESDG